MAVSLSNPFRRIVGVGWPSRYYAFRVRIESEERVTEATPCGSPEGGDNGNAVNYMIEASMEIETDAIWRLVSGTWEVALGATFTNDPAGPITPITFADATASATYVEPFRFTEISGSPIADITVPNHSGASFLNTSDLSYEVIGRELDPSGGVCNTIPLQGNFFQYPALTDPGAITSPVAVGIGDVVVNHNGKTYLPIGLYAVPNTKGSNPSVEISAPIEGWVLCERAPA